MELAYKKKRIAYVGPIFLLILLVIGYWSLNALIEGLSGHIVYSVTSLETSGQIIEQMKEESSRLSSNGGGGKNKPGIREEIEQARSRISKKDYKAALSNYKRLAEHVEKLEKYQRNPLKYDNLGLLNNAPSNAVRERIVASRVAHLEKEIQTFYNNIIKIIN